MIAESVSDHRAGGRRTPERIGTPGSTIPVRCAAYTRKSTEEGLGQEFNSLDAQRECIEAYVAAQKHEGWTLVPERYDDGGCTGADMDRNALKRLLAHVEQGELDAVLVYKIDRLSRNIGDFVHIIRLFDRHGVSFISVTQQFNTATSMGRLIVHVLMSCAQFERELISERTRDKIAAARRKGKWSGGHPVLGYDRCASPAGTKLVVNEAEAARVREIFQLYLVQGSLLAVVRTLAKHGWTNKRWQTKAGKVRGGRPFDKVSISQLLQSPLYLGKVSYKGTLYPGEHPAIVPAELWQNVQRQLRANRVHGRAGPRNAQPALLKGLVRCAACDCAMTHTFSVKKGPGGAARRYRYYVCTRAVRRGRTSCPSRPVPAAEMENFVVEQIRAIGRDPRLVRETLAQARQRLTETVERDAAERVALLRALNDHHAELRKLTVAADEADAARIADLNEAIARLEERLAELTTRETGKTDRLDERTLTEALARFEPVWDALATNERGELLRLLVERVEYDGRDGTVTIAFHSTGIRTLCERDGPQTTETEA